MYDYTQAKMNDDAIRAISCIGLAHLGDAVYELLVRTYLCVHGKATGKGLHRATVELVCAPQQAALCRKAILPLLTEEEARLCSAAGATPMSIPSPTSADRADYQKATGARGAVRLAVSTGTITRASTSCFNRMMEDEQCHLTRSACGQFYTS